LNPDKTKLATEVAQMKFQNILRMQAIVIGIGAVLFLASPTPGQEIVNTEFSDGPYVATFQQPTAKTSASATVTPAAQAPKVEVTSVAAPTPMIAEEVAASFHTNTSVVGWLLVSCLFGLAVWAIHQVLKFQSATSRR
jgi:hypothetical protein